MDKKILFQEQNYFSSIKKIIVELLKDARLKIKNLQKQDIETLNDMHDNFKIDSEYGVDIDSLWTEENIKRNDIYEKEQIKKIMSLNLVFNSPFFGKIEYCDQFGNEKIYIGLRGIQKENHLFVVDWRTPVCSLYYHAKLGKIFYYVNRKEVNVDLKTKRQFDIDNGRLVGYLDSDRKVNDELLVKILSNNTNHYMKNIVKTIQEEQDEVIRQDLETNIIVNGVAGSGKTSIAMHRIAYLLFDNRDILSNENIIFISPNNLFSKYIAHLLPELGEKNIYAFSLFDILKNKKIITFKHEERPEMINKILNGDKDRLAQYNIKFSFEYQKN